MMNPFFPESPEQSLAHAFSEHVVSWAKQIGHPDDDITDMLGKAAWYVSMAVSSGDACFVLDDLPEYDHKTEIGRIRQTLFDSGVVGTPDSPANCPLVLDEDNRLYLHRYFRYEQTLATCLVRMRQVREFDAKIVHSLLDSLFSADKNETSPDWQKLAVALALRQSLLIISGGPGTGKTTTVAKLLACLLKTAPDNRVMLAAPTGKAARRMLDSISERMDIFPPYMRSSIPTEAFTIHRLLGITTDFANPRYHAGNPLPCDTLIVDEASMLDLAMASRLFSALPETTRVILLGDKDQLAAVEAGSVFSELSSRFVLSSPCLDDLKEMTGYPLAQKDMPEAAGHELNAPDTPLKDGVVWLMKNYRFSETSGIGRLACDIRDRRITQAIRFLCDKNDPSVQWLDMDNPGIVSGFEKVLTDQFYDYLEIIRNHPDNVSDVFRIFNRSRILCAVREGKYGVNAVNHLLASIMAQNSEKPIAPTGRMNWFAGQPVMIRRNDYALKLFNGDVGIVLPDANGNLSAFFPNEDASFRAVSLSRINDFETSFAMTVHQSQGSEFDSVLLVLPPEPSRILSRELIYTGITRARSTIRIASRLTVLSESMKHDCVRRSGLLNRMAEALFSGQ